MDESAGRIVRKCLVSIVDADPEWQKVRQISDVIEALLGFASLPTSIDRSRTSTIRNCLVQSDFDELGLLADLVL